MRQDPRLWNAALIVLVIGIGIFWPGTEKPGSKPGSKPVGGKHDPAKTGPAVSTKAPGIIASTSGGKGGTKEDEAVQAWDKEIEAKIAEFNEAQEKQKNAPIIDPSWINEELTKNEAAKALERAEVAHRAEGYLEFLPEAERQAKLGRIHEAAANIVQNPDSPDAYVKHAEALEDAKLHGPAFNSMTYAYNRFTDSSEVAMGYGDLGRKWSLRHMAEDGYERAITLPATNDSQKSLAKQGLAEVKRWDYHPGYVHFGWIPQERLKNANSNKGE